VGVASELFKFSLLASTLSVEFSIRRRGSYRVERATWQFLVNEEAVA